MAGSQLSSSSPRIEAPSRHQPLQLEGKFGSDRHQIRRLAREVGESVQCVATQQLRLSAGDGRRWRSPHDGRRVIRSRRCASRRAAQRTAARGCHHRPVRPTTSAAISRSASGPRESSKPRPCHRRHPPRQAVSRARRRTGPQRCLPIRPRCEGPLPCERRQRPSCRPRRTAVCGRCLSPLSSTSIACCGVAPHLRSVKPAEPCRGFPNPCVATTPTSASP